MSAKVNLETRQVILNELENIAGNFQPALLGSEQYWYSRAGPGETVGFTRGRQMSAICYPALTMDVDISEIVKASPSANAAQKYGFAVRPSSGYSCNYITDVIP
jgi:hypothetical protein